MKNLKSLHHSLVASGNLLVANNILRLMMNKSIILGLNDTDYETELILIDFGLKHRITRTFNIIFKIN